MSSPIDSSGNMFNLWSNDAVITDKSVLYRSADKSETKFQAASTRMFQQLKESVSESKTKIGSSLVQSISQISAQNTTLVEQSLETTVVDEDKKTPTQVLQGSHSDMEAAYKEAYEKLWQNEQGAIKYITDLKAQLTASNAANSTLISDINTQVNRTLDENLTEFSSSKNDLAKEMRLYQLNEQKQLQAIRQNPPPKFSTANNTAAGLVMFLNDELEEYFLEMGVDMKRDRCRHIHKIFANFDEYKQTTKRFFQEEMIANIVEDNSTNIKVIYSNLVNYIFMEAPHEKMPVRLSLIHI